jgi:DNA segregation ATPase FtsK/SpoIIIE-like protein
MMTPVPVPVVPEREIAAAPVVSEMPVPGDVESEVEAAPVLDPKFREAVVAVSQGWKVSEPLLRRELKVSGERARALMDQMAAAGLISGSQGQGKARLVYREKFASLLHEEVE